MKKLILTAIIAFSSIGLFAQPLPPVFGGNGDQPTGGSTPIDNGIAILLILSASLAARKVYILRTKTKENA